MDRCWKVVDSMVTGQNAPGVRTNVPELKITRLRVKGVEAVKVGLMVLAMG